MYRIAMVAVALVGAAGVAPAGEKHSRAVRELRAGCWLNHRVGRLRDDRLVVLYVFDASARPDRQTARALRLLNRLARRRATLVVGLTPSDCRTAGRFVHRYRVRFPVGADSPTARALAAEGLPRLLRLDHAGGKGLRPRSLEPEQLAALLPAGQQYTADDVRRLREPWQLVQVVRSRAPYEVRELAVRRLHELSDPQAFIEVADALLADEPNPWVRSWLEYYRDLASGVDRPGLEQHTPSTSAWLDYRSNPDAPQWKAVHTFLQSMHKQYTVDLLLDALRDHAGDTPADLVIRRLAAQELVNLAADHKPQVRDRLMQWLPSESDPSVRMYLAYALSYACEPGDSQAAQLLRDLAAVETRIVLVRPELEYLARVIETGEEDPDRLFVRADD